jgi:hypothetical protein
MDILKQELKEKKKDWIFSNTWFALGSIAELSLVTYIFYISSLTMKIFIVVYFIVLILISIFLSKINFKKTDQIEILEFTNFENDIIKIFKEKYKALTKEEIDTIKVQNNGQFFFPAAYFHSQKFIMFVKKNYFVENFASILAHELGHALTSKYSFFHNKFIFYFKPLSIPGRLLSKFLIEPSKKNKFLKSIFLILSPFFIVSQLILIPENYFSRKEEYRANRLSLLFSDGFSLRNDLMIDAKDYAFTSNNFIFQLGVIEHSVKAEFFHFNKHFNFKYKALESIYVKYIDGEYKVLSDLFDKIPLETLKDWISYQKLELNYNFSFAVANYFKENNIIDEAVKYYLIAKKLFRNPSKILGEIYDQFRYYGKAILHLNDYLKNNENSEEHLVLRLQSLKKVVTKNFHAYKYLYYKEEIENPDAILLDDNEDIQLTDERLQFHYDFTGKLFLNQQEQKFNYTIYKDFIEVVYDNDSIKRYLIDGDELISDQIKLEDNEYYKFLKIKFKHSSNE